MTYPFTYGGIYMELSELRKKPHISISAINEYVECSLLYKFAKIDRIPFELKPDAMEFGTAIHRILEQFYLNKMTGYKMLLKDIHASFENIWKDIAEGRDDIEYTKGNTFQSLMMMGRDLLTVWYNKLADDNFTIIGVEEAFSLNIPDLPIPLIGCIDLVEADDSGTIIITDFKTSARSYSNDEVDKNQQLTTYQLAMKNHGYNDREILLRFDVFIKTQIKKVKQYYTTRSELDEQRLITKIHRVWDGIQKEVFLPNDLGWKCKNCHYKKACDEFLLRRVV
jgi:putative RecB family exonuclease